jgi:LemA protein
VRGSLGTVTAVVIVLLVVAAIVLIAAGVFVVTYRAFTRQRHAIEESWRRIDGELRRRHELIAGLVEVTSSARFDQQALTQVMTARTQAVAAHGAGPSVQGHAEQALNGALANFFTVAEAYPDLRSDQSYGQLQQRMVETEDRVAGARRHHNDTAMAYNRRLDTFPARLVANVGRFRKRELYEVDEPGVRAAPVLAEAFDQVTPTPALGLPAIQPQRNRPTDG